MRDHQPSPPSAPLTGSDLLAALEYAANHVDAQAPAINALNVFPVPDGDTGTNMALTLRSAVEKARGVPTERIDDVCSALAHGSLMGARGNSGVILAQMFRAMASSLAGRPTGDASALAAAFRAGADAAYSAVTNPVEGTILTVARAAADAAGTAARSGRSVGELFERAHAAAREAVARTPDQLPILKQAGVVDSGGEGYRVLLEGLAASIRGEPPPSLDACRIDVRANLAALHHEGDTYGYCTEVLFQGEDIDIDDLRRRLRSLGTSVLVVGDPSLLKLHVHTPRPGQVLEIATARGEILNVKVDNIALQRRELETSAPATPPSGREAGTGVVAVAAGDGFAEIFESLGATIVRCGSTMNPAVEEILDAIKRAPRTHVVVLPNDPNAILASEAAARMADDRAVSVIPTRDMPQGISAALALSPSADLTVNVPALRAAAERCQTVALARAARGAILDGLCVVEGEHFGTLNHRAVATGPAVDVVLHAAMSALPAGTYEIATIYVGAGGDKATAQALGALLRARLGVSTEVMSGGQPHYEYIIGIE